MSYRDLVRLAGPSFVVLGLFARLPYAMLPLGTLLFAHAETGGPAFAGLVAGAQSLAVAAGGLLAALLADRIGTRLVGTAAAVADALAIGALLAAPTRPGVLVAAVVVGLCQPQVGPFVRVHWQHLGADRRTAMAFEAALDEAGFVAGPLLVALLGMLGPGGPLAGMAVLLLGAAAPLGLRYRGRRVVTRSALPREIGFLVGGMATVGAVFGVIQVGVAAHPHAGVLYALLSACGAVSGLWYGRRRPAPLSVTALWLLAGTSVLAVAGPLAVVAAGLVIAPHMVNLFVRSGTGATGIAVLGAGGPVGTAVGQAVAGQFAEHAFLVAPVAAVVAVALSRR